MALPDDTLSYIKKYYLSSSKPVKKVFSKYCFNKNVLTVETQLLILNSTILHPTAVKYSNKPYARQFLKFFIHMLEERKLEVSESLYTLYADLVTENLTQDNLCYHSYFLGENETITLLESTCFIGENTTGLRTWEAGKQLSEWCFENSVLFHGKCILELGSGIGLTGIIIANTCKPRKYVFTDCNDSVLKLLQENLAINDINLRNMSIHVKKLFWGDSHQYEDLIGKIDYVVAADVIYDPDDHGKLCCTIKEINPTQGTIVAIKERDPETRLQFEECLGKNCLSFSLLKPAQTNLFFYEDDITFYIYKITS